MTEAALRKRRQREYQRQRAEAGLAVYRLTLPEVDLADMLVAGRFLDPLAADDHAAVEKALERLMAMLMAEEKRLEI
jgi:hypothetical protein